jgi:hypothetical protein
VEVKGEPVEELEEVDVGDGKILKIGFLRENMEAFT